jgi:hypothetical protein
MFASSGFRHLTPARGGQEITVPGGANFWEITDGIKKNLHGSS